ncbi:MAG: primosomal protein DnaI [Bacilli bacterium]
MKGLNSELKVFKKSDNDYELKGNYGKALKDENFKKLVSNIKLSSDNLMKYTSRLEECALEKGNCEHCKNLFECKNKVEGFLLTPIANKKNLTFSYVACSYKNKDIKNTSYKENVLTFDIPKEISNAKMKDIYTDDKNRFEVIKKLKDFIDKYLAKKEVKGLYLHGNFGCGKTYVVASMFNELAKKGIKSVIVYWPELLRSLKESFKSNNYEYKFSKIKKAPLLLLDDLGAENLTSWGRDEILGSILQYRMQEGLPTFFTSNLDIKELEEHLSFSNGKVEKVKARRIIERINQLTDTIQMISENRRK